MNFWVFLGRLTRDFCLQVFFMNQFPPGPEYLLRPLSSVIYFTGVVVLMINYRWGPWHQI
jgi:hypothetical protein